MAAREYRSSAETRITEAGKVVQPFGKYRADDRRVWASRGYDGGALSFSAWLNPHGVRAAGRACKHVSQAAFNIERRATRPISYIAT